jgi:cell division protein FtsX
VKSRRLAHLVASNLRASRVRAVLAMIGIVVGTALLTFFLGLGQGLRERVLNRIFPANQLELEPRAVQLFGVEQQVGQSPLDDARVAQVARLPGVVRAFGKQKSTFPARLWGGKELLGYNLFTEAFFDGMPVAMLRSELAEFEDVPGKLAAGRRGGPQRCDVDLDCRPGSVCRDAACEVIVWMEKFREDVHLVLPCASDDECATTATCSDGRCIARSGVTAAAQRCLLPAPAGNGRDMDFAREQGALASRCAAGEAGVQGWCASPGACPNGEYCAGDNPDSTLGWCEEPLPAIINPLLLEVFNSDMARSLGAAPIGSLAVLYGVRLHVALGDSFFVQDAARARQQYKQAQIVGFSRKAPELGLALPLPVVRHFNARLKGPQAAATYDAVLVETADNEAVPPVVSAAESLGFSLSRKSRAARTFGTVVFVTSLALILLAAMVLVVSAIQIAQTFAMLVHERRREIAVLRAIGAARRDVLALILGEAAVIGLCGGGLGAGLAFLGGWTVDTAAHNLLQHVPLLPPEGFFVFAWWAAPLAVAVALVCCIAGALGPARRASRLDPARVLAES